MTDSASIVPATTLRRRAVRVHLGISLFAVSIGAALLLRWFSPPYFFPAGGAHLAAMLAGVTLTAGPLLTWIVYKPGKRGLHFDLACILLIQSMVFAFGLFVAAGARPIFLVAAVDRFELVSARDISDEDLAQGREERYRHRAWNGPKLVHVEPPNDPDEYNALSLGAMRGRDLKNLPKYFRDYDDNRAALLSRGRPLTVLYDDDGRKQHIEAWLRHRGLDADRVVWLPLATQRRDLTALLERSQGTFLGTIDVEPLW